jgi:hypothetical protein
MKSSLVFDMLSERKMCQQDAADGRTALLLTLYDIFYVPYRLELDVEDRGACVPT